MILPMRIIVVIVADRSAMSEKIASNSCMMAMGIEQMQKANETASSMVVNRRLMRR